MFSDVIELCGAISFVFIYNKFPDILKDKESSLFCSDIMAMMTNELLDKNREIIFNWYFSIVNIQNLKDVPGELFEYEGEIMEQHTCETCLYGDWQVNGVKTNPDLAPLFHEECKGCCPVDDHWKPRKEINNV